MDVVTILLIVLIVVFLFGGVAWPRPAEGPAVVSLALYVVLVIVVIVLLLRLLGVLL